MHEVLPQGLQSAQEAEETVSVRVLGFLPPLLFRRPSRRSFDHATRYARVRRRDPRRFEKTPPRLSSYFRLETITRSREYLSCIIHTATTAKLPSTLRSAMFFFLCRLLVRFAKRGTFLFRSRERRERRARRVVPLAQRRPQRVPLRARDASGLGFPRDARPSRPRLRLGVRQLRARERDACHRLLVAEPQARQPPLALGPLARRRRVVGSSRRSLKEVRRQRSSLRRFS